MLGKAKVLIIVSALFTLAMGLSNVFVNIFLWKESNDFILIAGYNLMHYIFAPLTFIFAGWLAKRKNGIWSLRIGVLCFILLFTLIVLLKSAVVQFAYPLGILFGIAAGFYWLAFNVLCFDMTCIENRDSFNGCNGCITGAANAAAPLLSAFIIQNNRGITGYTIVFAISLALFILLILVTLTLKSERYSKKLVFNRLLSNNCDEWKEIRKSTAAWGMRDVIIVFLINILIFKTTGSELSVGKLSLMASLVSSASYLIEQRLINPKRRIIFMHIGAIAAFIAVLGLAFKVNFHTLLFYVLMDAAFIPYFLVPLNSATYNVINRNHDEDLRVEYVINREIMLGSGRTVTTIILIILLVFIKYDRTLNYYLLFIGLGPVIGLISLRKLKIWKENR